MSALPPPLPPMIGASSLMTCPAGTFFVRSSDVRTISEALPSLLRPITTTPDLIRASKRSAPYRASARCVTAVFTDADVAVSAPVPAVAKFYLEDPRTASDGKIARLLASVLAAQGHSARTHSLFHRHPVGLQRLVAPHMITQ